MTSCPVLCSAQYSTLLSTAMSDFRPRREAGVTDARALTGLKHRPSDVRGIVFRNCSRRGSWVLENGGVPACLYALISQLREKPDTRMYRILLCVLSLSGRKGGEGRLSEVYTQSSPVITRTAGHKNKADKQE